MNFFCIAFPPPFLQSRCFYTCHNHFDFFPFLLLNLSARAFRFFSFAFYLPVQAFDLWSIHLVPTICHCSSFLFIWHSIPSKDSRYSVFAPHLPSTWIYFGCLDLVSSNSSSPTTLQWWQPMQAFFNRNNSRISIWIGFRWLTGAPFLTSYACSSFHRHYFASFLVFFLFILFLALLTIPLLVVFVCFIGRFHARIELQSPSFDSGACAVKSNLCLLRSVPTPGRSLWRTCSLDNIWTLGLRCVCVCARGGGV